jgi:hypothetical protein
VLSCNVHNLVDLRISIGIRLDICAPTIALFLACSVAFLFMKNILVVLFFVVESERIDTCD